MSLLLNIFLINYIKHILILFLLIKVSIASAIDVHQSFIQNKGQLDSQVLFEKQLPNGSLFIEDGLLKFVYYNEQEWKQIITHPIPKTFNKKPKTLHYHTLILKFEGAHFNNVSTNNEAIGFINYYLQNNPKNWASNVKGFGELYFKNVWPKIDLEIIAQGNSFKYNFIIHAGADIGKIKTSYEGATYLKLKNKNNLTIKTSVNEYIEKLPLAYIKKEGAIQPISCNYILNNNTISFSTSKDYSAYTLVLDPILVFSTYSGSTVDNFGFTATYDSKGSLYAGGIASKPTKFPSGRYPTTVGAFQYSYGGGDGNGWEGFPCDISISKYTPNGDSLVWATYLGGTKNEYPHSIVVDQNDQLIVFGTTTSRDFPTTVTAFDTSFNGSFDIIVSKFSHDGSKLIGSSYIGGSAEDGFNVDGPLKYNYADEFRGEVDVDNYGSIYIATCTRSKNFPVSAFAPQTKANDSLEAVMIKLDSNLVKLDWSSYWGMKGEDAFYSIEIVNDTLVYIGGSTTSKGMLTDTLAIDTAYKGGRADGYIACFTNDSLKYIRATYIGTSEYNQVYFIEQDIKGKIYATGQTDGVFPIVGSVYSQPNSGQFIIKLSPDLRQVILSTTFGNGSQTADLKPSAFMVDYCENVYFSGWGSDVANPSDQVGTTLGLYVSNNAVQKTTDGNDFYLIVFSKNLQGVAYATFFGSPGQSGEFSDHVDGGTSRFDPRGVVYQSVCSSCPAGNLSNISNFPTTASAFSKTNPSPRCSNASFKIDFQISNAVIADFTVLPRSQCFPGNITITNKSIGGKKFFWDFGDGKQDTAKNPSHIYTQAGEYNIRLIVYDSNSCNVMDTAYRNITLLQTGDAKFDIIKDSCSYKVSVLNKSNYILSTEWHWGDGSKDTTTNASHTYTSKGSYTIKLILNKGLPCSDSIEQTITLKVDSNIKAGFTKTPASGCNPLTVNFTNTSNTKGAYLWSFGDGKTDTVENPVHIYKDSGIYIVKLKLVDIYGCGLKDSLTDTIRVNPKAQAAFNTATKLCDLTVDIYNQTIDGKPYFWDFGDGQTDTNTSPSYTYKKGGTYTIRLITGVGTLCPDTAEQTLEIKQDSSGDLVMPNVFTPDEDGMNDCFKPGGVQSGCDDFKMYIYNMWGELLFETEDINNCWTGKDKNNKEHPTGTYYWLMEVAKGKGKKIKTKGHVLLLRKE